MVMAAAVATAAATAWAHARVEPVRAYYVDGAMCPAVLSRFWNDALLGWAAPTCDDLRASVRDAFGEWQANAVGLRVRETRDETEADFVVRAGDIADAGHVAAVYLSAREAATVEALELDTHPTCWHGDRAFCSGVQAHAVAVDVACVVAWLTGLIGALGAGLVAPARWRGALGLLSWSLLLTVPIVYFGTVRPCATCHDLRSVLLHEAGHVFGFLHPDDRSIGHMCGCGGDALPCVADVHSVAIMHSIARTREHGCLEDDDVAAVRTIYGGDCDAPAVCRDAGAGLGSRGAARLCVAAAYGALAAGAVVALQAAVCVRLGR